MCVEHGCRKIRADLRCGGKEQPRCTRRKGGSGIDMIRMGGGGGQDTYFKRKVKQWRKEDCVVPCQTQRFFLCVCVCVYVRACSCACVSVYVNALVSVSVCGHTCMC